MKKLFQLVLILAGLSQFTLHASGEARLLRFPAIYGNQIVFSNAGDLFSVDSDGGIARKKPVRRTGPHGGSIPR